MQKVVRCPGLSPAVGTPPPLNWGLRHVPLAAFREFYTRLPCRWKRAHAVGAHWQAGPCPATKVDRWAAAARAYLARLYMVSAAEPSDVAGLRVFISSAVIDLITLF
jgi:hypothetical protein